MRFNFILFSVCEEEDIVFGDFTPEFSNTFCMSRFNLVLFADCKEEDILLGDFMTVFSRTSEEMDASDFSAFSRVKVNDLSQTGHAIVMPFHSS